MFYDAAVHICTDDRRSEVAQLDTTTQQIHTAVTSTYQMELY